MSAPPQSGDPIEVGTLGPDGVTVRPADETIARHHRQTAAAKERFASWERDQAARTRIFRHPDGRFWEILATLDGIYLCRDHSRKRCSRDRALAS